MKRKGISTTENTERTEVDAVASGHSVANTEDLPDGFQMTELGPLPKEWRVVRLGEVVEKPQYGFTAAAQRDPVGPKMLRITDIQDGNVNWNAVPYCECGNDDNLSPSRYVSTNGKEEVLPLEEAVVRLLEAEEERAEADRALNEVLRRLGML